MPTLSWINDNQARQDASKVPFHLLEKVESYGDLDSENILVQGDNLLALKALLPFYRGKVKCIYIDPPYNTGSAFEHYDDNMEHSQWLSMMMPRLRLLREFLSEEGSIWISIDGDEEAYLKVLVDEIFGRNQYLGTIVWQKRTSPDMRATLSDGHEYILAYCINKDKFKQNRNNLPLSSEQAKTYKNPDNDPRGPWTSADYTAQGYRPNQMYEIKTPGGKIYTPPQGKCWKNVESVFLNLVEESRIWFGSSGNNIPRKKTFLSEHEGVTPWTWWTNKEVGHSQEAKKEILGLFGSINVFDTPKPERLIQRVLTIATNQGDLVLDSFLGSGTTTAVAHKMGRRYIGIEMGEHAKTHCIPRLQKVIEGEQGGISKSVNWQGGGGFLFYKLGEKVFDETGAINPKVDFKTLAAYIWQKETNTPSECQSSPLIGQLNGKSIFLLYNGILGDIRPRAGNVLNRNILKRLLEEYPTDNEKIIYGDACFGISDEELKANKVTFKQIPYDLGI